MLDRITPIVLTFNEEANIRRSLNKLDWARDIVVIDSYSTDSTLDALRSNPQVRLLQRRFDTHSDQWNFAIRQSGVTTDWVLTLDADYILTDEFIEEVGKLAPGPEIAGYWVSFKYCINGQPLWGSLYPPVIALYRKNKGAYVQDGHTQRIKLDGSVGRLRNSILHDDRKPLSRWLASQEGYAELEAQKISESPFRALPWQDRIRKVVVVAPVACLPYCLFFKGGVLQGLAGFYYAFQRTLVEVLIALKLLDRKLFKRD